MTDYEILRNAIKKAKTKDIHFEQFLDNLTFIRLEYNEHFNIIFSQRFCIAFFGEQRENKIISVPGLSSLISSEMSWKIHIVNMVLSEKPLKYLEKFL